ncbi:hypothetical protein HMPREF9056_02324 [Actinomyces sp. oral taxon 170 str. F0386]|nr:hypothetical protein HMPREF9056_02324 [Actinomyces sp. oral taxon 170 str. F0386]
MAIMPRHLDPPGDQGGPGSGAGPGGAGARHMICESTTRLILLTARQVVGVLTSA